MFKDWTYAEVKDKAEHLKAIGTEEIYLNKEPYPWHLVNRMETGGSHRLDIATSVWLYAADPDSGLALRWSFDIKNREANGKGYYEVNKEECHRIIQLLPPAPQKQFRRYLVSCAKAIEKNAAEYLDIANKGLDTAKTLRSI
jgi:hypothetical protein